MGDPVIEARGLRREFGGRAVLRGIDLRVEPGEVVALLGPNGAGKTTLLRVLALLLRPGGGTLRLMGREVADDRRAVLRHVGWVGHEHGSYPDLTGRENLAFHAELRGIADPDTRIEELLGWAGLGEAAERPVRTYSRGMQQRLALARVLLHAPDVLLLDEPLTGLDPSGVAALVGLLGTLAQAGHAIVMSVHDPAPVASVVTRAGIVHRGGLTWIDGTPAGDPVIVAAAWERVVVRGRNA